MSSPPEDKTPDFNLIKFHHDQAKIKEMKIFRFIDVRSLTCAIFCKILDFLVPTVKKCLPARNADGVKGLQGRKGAD